MTNGVSLGGWGVKMSQDQIVVTVAQPWEYTKITELYALKDSIL